MELVERIQDFLGTDVTESLTTSDFEYMNDLGVSKDVLKKVAAALGNVADDFWKFSSEEGTLSRDITNVTPKEFIAWLRQGNKEGAAKVKLPPASSVKKAMALISQAMADAGTLKPKEIAAAKKNHGIKA